MNIKQQLEIQAMYDAKSEALVQPEKATKPRSALGPIDAAQAQAQTTVRPRGRPRKAA